MSGIIRKTRQEMGMSMQQLADILGVSTFSVSSMERNDIKGTIKVETRDRALAAMGKAVVTTVVPLADDPERLMKMVAWNMSLEGQDIDEEDKRDIVAKSKNGK
jgi:predicted transcriptional regulator